MTIRHTVAAAALLLGLVMIATGLGTTPHATTISCSQAGTASQDGTSAETTTPHCTKTTQPATGQQLYLVGLGFVASGLGVGIVLGDAALNRRRN